MWFAHLPGALFVVIRDDFTQFPDHGLLGQAGARRFIMQAGMGARLETADQRGAAGQPGFAIARQRYESLATAKHSGAQPKRINTTRGAINKAAVRPVTVAVKDHGRGYHAALVWGAAGPRRTIS